MEKGARELTDEKEPSDAEYLVGAIEDGLSDFEGVYDLATKEGRLGLAEELRDMIKEFYLKHHDKELIDKFVEKIRYALNQIAPDDSTWGMYEIMDYLDKLVKEYQKRRKT